MQKIEALETEKRTLFGEKSCTEETPTEDDPVESRQEERGLVETADEPLASVEDRDSEPEVSLLLDDKNTIGSSKIKRH